MTIYSYRLLEDPGDLYSLADIKMRDNAGRPFVHPSIHPASQQFWDEVFETHLENVFSEFVDFLT